jgi:hypothetical protein
MITDFWVGAFGATASTKARCPICTGPTQPFGPPVNRNSGISNIITFCSIQFHSLNLSQPKAKNEMNDPIVITKKEVAEKWCQRASDHAGEHGGKPWRYALISHDIIADNMTLEGLT